MASLFSYLLLVYILWFIMIKVKLEDRKHSSVLNRTSKSMLQARSIISIELALRCTKFRASGVED